MSRMWSAVVLMADVLGVWGLGFTCILHVCLPSSVCKEMFSRKIPQRSYTRKSGFFLSKETEEVLVT
jgi:hypothetical protein